MNRLRFIDAKPDLARIAGSTGFAVTDERFLSRLNRAIEELMNAGDWPGVVDRYRFAVYGGSIVLPGDLNRIVGIAADGAPLEMVSPWYEFAGSGPGPQDGQTWSDKLLDRGETTTFYPLPADTPCTLQIVGERDERVSGVRPKITLQGYGETGAWIQTGEDSALIEGEEIAINGDTAPKRVLSENLFLSVESIIKPITRGFVHLYADDGTTRYHLGTYAPNETLPSYRRYVVPFLDPAKTHHVLVRARRRFVPLRKDGDFLIITNMGALESMLIALQKRQADDAAGYWNNRRIAIGLLKEEAAAYRGTTPRPAITFASGFGMDGVEHAQ